MCLAGPQYTPHNTEASNNKLSLLSEVKSLEKVGKSGHIEQKVSQLINARSLALYFGVTVLYATVLAPFTALWAVSQQWYAGSGGSCGSFSSLLAKIKPLGYP